jgi:hypothetical protein
MIGLLFTAALVGVGYAVGSGYVRVGKKKRQSNPADWSRYSGKRTR